MESETSLKGLGGWLILVGIGLLISPIRLGSSYIPMYYELFTDGTFDVLTDPMSDVFHPFWAPLLISEAVFNTLLVLASVYLIFLFFRKSYLFPKVYIALIVTSLVFIPLDAWLGSFVLPDEPIFDQEIITELSRVLLSAAIWIPYMLRSERVKLTFVEGKSVDNSDGEIVAT
ncbi:MAG: DUF2569 domain-containing protein [Kangiellaceae bacterium]|jgi:hypothetical protein|nr:DUF2569 domain-containing protein [Kangiellaceae bacterium]